MQKPEATVLKEPDGQDREDEEKVEDEQLQSPLMLEELQCPGRPRCLAAPHPDRTRHLAMPPASGTL